MTEPHDWLFEQPARGSLRRWCLTATGYLAVLFPDGQEAQRAEQGLLQRGVLAKDVRLYDAEEVLSIASRLQRERSILAKTIAAVVSDREARQRYLGNTMAGGSALWLFAPTEDRADQLVGFSPTTTMSPCATTATRASRTSMAASTDSRPRHEPPNDHSSTPAHQPSTTAGATGSRRSRAWAASLADPLHAIYGPAARSRR